MKEKGKHSLLRSTAGLALAGIIAKVVGAFYRIPLTNILGAEGIGLYQTFFPVYALFLTLTSAALPTVVARYVAYADALKVDIPATRAAAKRTAVVSGLIGLVCAAALAYPAAALQSRPSVWKGYLVVAPAVLAVTVSTYYKGYFIGKGRMTANALSQTAEQAVKLAVGLMAALALSKYGATAAVYGALFAVTVSEIAGLVFMAAAYRKDTGKENIYRVRVDKTIYYDIIKNILPILAAALIVPVSSFLDSFVIVRMLTAGGASLADATSDYGIYSGAVGTVINLPVVIAVSLAVAVLPKISSGVAKGEYVRVNEATGLTLSACLAVAVPCFFAILVFAPDVVSALYPGFSATDATRTSDILRLQAFNVIAASAVQLLCGILQALGSGRSAAAYLAFGVAVKTVIQIFLLPYIGIKAAPVAQIVMYTLAAALSVVKYLELVGKNPQLVQSGSKILLCGVIMSVCIRAVALTVGNMYVRLAVGVATGVTVYFALLALTGLLNKKGLATLFRRGKGDSDD